MDPDDPMLTVPLPRYNAMLAVLRNTLYMCVSEHRAQSAVFLRPGQYLNCVCHFQIRWHLREGLA